MKTFVVDSFTDKPFAGNPAGVCLVEQALSDELMLQVARELGYSETAFIQVLDDDASYSIRFFSPVMEIPLCGHATLAAAQTVFDLYAVSQVCFTNTDGLVLVARAAGDEIILEFPVYDTHPAEAPQALLDALRIRAVKNVAFNKETCILLIEIDDSDVLGDLQPDFTALYQSHDAINGVLVTAPSKTDEYDFHSRYFWPWSGTNEDPVTGGTHTFLTKYWSTRLGKTAMRSFQSSERTGFMQVELRDDTLLITSQAVIVLRGEMVLPPATR